MGVSQPERSDWHPQISALHAYWSAIAPPGLLPGRQHVDPTAIPRLLPHVWMMDVQSSPLRFRWRLIGTEAQAGKLLLRPGDRLDDHLEGEELARAEAVLREVVQGRRPSWARGRPVMPHAATVLSLERVILPLARDGETVDMLLGATVYDWAQSGTSPSSRRSAAL